MVETMEICGKDVARKFTKTGGYPIFYRMDVYDHCPDCALELTESTSRFDGTTVAAVNYEDPDLYCDECEDRIESAYAEEE